MAFSHTLKLTLERLRLLRLAYWINERIRVAKVAIASRHANLEGFADGLPLPPPSLLVAIGGATTPAAYLHGGEQIAGVIENTLARQGVEIGALGAILDFGCGSGRVLRKFRRLASAVDLHGCDYDPRLVEWCAENLPFATFQQNDLAPPLPYGDGAFDLVYSFSVFTHLPEPLQLAWIRELRRVTKPNGYLIFTVQSDDATRTLTPAEEARFREGHLVVRYASVAGSNLCASFHPVAYLQRTLAAGWGFVDTFDSPVGQRFVVLRR